MKSASIVTGVATRELELVEALLAGEPDKADDAVLASLTGCVLAERNPERMEKLLNLVAGLPAQSVTREVALLNGLSTSPVVTARRPMKLAAEPAAFALLQQSSNKTVQTALKKAASVLTWPGKPGAVGEAKVEPLTAEQ